MPRAGRARPAGPAGAAGAPPGCGASARLRRSGGVRCPRGAGGRDGRRPVDRGAGEVLAEDRGVQGLQLLPGVDAQFAGEPVAGPRVHGEGVRLPAEPVLRRHHLAREPFAPRVGARLGVQLGHRLQVPQQKRRLSPCLDGRQPYPRQPLTLLGERRVVRQLLVRRAAPQLRAPPSRRLASAWRRSWCSRRPSAAASSKRQVSTCPRRRSRTYPADTRRTSGSGRPTARSAPASAAGARCSCAGRPGPGPGAGRTTAPPVTAARARRVRAASRGARAAHGGAADRGRSRGRRTPPPSARAAARSPPGRAPDFRSPRRISCGSARATTGN